jgi:hypothetical protein
MLIIYSEKNNKQIITNYYSITMISQFVKRIHSHTEL